MRSLVTSHMRDHWNTGLLRCRFVPLRRRLPKLEDSLRQFVRAFLRKKVTAVWTNRAALPLPVADRDHLLITLSLGCRDSGRVVFCDPERQSGVDHGKTQEAISKGPKEKRGESTP